jgi:hypothetical protein
MEGESVHMVLPTEPGIYLFLGIHDDSDIFRPDYPELLRVHRRADGELWYVGRDFWYWHTLQSAVGVWISITPHPKTVELASGLVLARQAVAWASKHANSWLKAERGLTIDQILRYTSPYRNDDKAALPLAECAILLGLLIEDGKNSFGEPIYRFKTPSPTPAPDPSK